MARVAVIGTGYVGTVTAACLARVGHEVMGFDVEQDRVRQLAAGQLPFFEPGLDRLLFDALTSGRLGFTSAAARAVRGADVVFLCVGTPPGHGGQPDMSQVERAVELLAPHLGDDTVVAGKSTVPVGSGNWLRAQLEDLRGARAVQVVSNPEFLREGCAVEDFLYPDRIVVGGEEPGRSVVADVYRPIVDQSFPGGRTGVRPQLIRTDLPSAELLKYAANAFLAMKVSFANEMATVCDLVGADVSEVMGAIGADHRIGSEFLAAGLGWGGSCFGKDLAALEATALEYGRQTPLLRAVQDVNAAARASAVRRLQAELKILKGRRIAVLGLSFKPGTDDLRDSPALDVVRGLVRSGCLVSVHDPVVKELPDDIHGVRVAGDPYDAACRADAVVLATAWDDHVAIDLAELASCMSGRVVLDGRNCLNRDAAQAAGLTLLQIGR